MTFTPKKMQYAPTWILRNTTSAESYCCVQCLLRPRFRCLRKMQAAFQKIGWSKTREVAGDSITRVREVLQKPVCAEARFIRNA
jgi:hypothetical protein